METSPPSIILGTWTTAFAVKMETSIKPMEASKMQEKQRSRELKAFLFLTVVLGPAIAITLVGGYGFINWFYQFLAGPPGAA